MSTVAPEGALGRVAVVKCAAQVGASPRRRAAREGCGRALPAPICVNSDAGPATQGAGSTEEFGRKHLEHLVGRRTDLNTLNVTKCLENG